MRRKEMILNTYSLLLQMDDETLRSVYHVLRNLSKGQDEYTAVIRLFEWR